VDAATQLYGHADPKAPAKLLFQRSGIDTPAWEKLEAGAALSALFYFNGERGKLVEEVATELGLSAEAARAVALPFFASP